MEMDCILKNLASIFKVLVGIFKATRKTYVDYSSCKKLIDVLVLNFRAMLLARVKVTTKNCCIVLTGKQEVP